jgi:hypothetical protein
MPAGSVLDVLNGATKYYPWFAPHLNTASSAPLPFSEPPYAQVFGPRAPT